jgi:hemerythrin superfamily protein
MAERRDVIEVLTEDHRVITRLAEQLEEADKPAEVRDLFLHMVEKLAAHEAAEQQVLFPAVRALLPASSDEARTRLSEHEEINELLVEMRSLRPDGLAFAKRASALVLDIQGHFQAEEEVLFPRLVAAIAKADLIELADKVTEVMEHSPAFPAEPQRARLL